MLIRRPVVIDGPWFRFRGDGRWGVCFRAGVLLASVDAPGSLIMTQFRPRSSVLSVCLRFAAGRGGVDALLSELYHSVNAGSMSACGKRPGICCSCHSCFSASTLSIMSCSWGPAPCCCSCCSRRLSPGSSGVSATKPSGFTSKPVPPPAWNPLNAPAVQKPHTRPTTPPMALKANEPHP